MPYHTNEQLVTGLERSAERAGSRARLSQVGESVDGQPILAVTVAGPARLPDPSRAQVLLTANIHGNEVITSEVALGALDWLTADELRPEALALLDLADATIVPAVNPDGRRRPAQALHSGTPMLQVGRGNGRGVDLNRNFPYPADARDAWHPLSGTGVSWLPWYRGDAPLSEPESRALAKLAEQRRFRAALHLHSVGRLFLYPYCYTDRQPADLPAFLAMGDAFLAARTGPDYVVKQSRTWYAILGDLDDWMYDALGTLSATVEVSTPLAGVGSNPLRLLDSLMWMNPRDPTSSVHNNVPACLAALAEGVRQKS